jgi:hypothetical protein
VAGNEENTDFLSAFNQQIKAINDLATAIAALVIEQNCTPEVNVSCPPPVVNVTVSQGTPGGSEVPSGEGNQGESPPTGFEDIPPTAPYDRKCRVANMIYDHVAGTLTQLDTLDVDQYGAIGLTLTTSLVGAALGSVVPALGTFLGAIAGVLVGIGVILVTGEAAIDLGIC